MIRSIVGRRHDVTLERYRFYEMVRKAIIWRNGDESKTSVWINDVVRIDYDIFLDGIKNHNHEVAFSVGDVDIFFRDVKSIYIY
jgi:hypothetical protein